MAESNSPEQPFDLNTFRAITEDGFQKVCRFALRFNRPRLMTSQLTPQSLQEMTYLCEAAEFTGKGMQTLDVRYYGPSMKLPFNIQFNDLNVTILCRRDMQERKFFDYWLNLINPSNTYDFTYVKDYSTKVEIFAFDETGESVYKQTLERCYPTQITPTQTMWADDQIARVAVTLTYRRFLTVDEPPPLPALSTLVSGSAMVWGSVLGTSIRP